jgi:hypothetical protein
MPQKRCSRMDILKSRCAKLDSDVTLPLKQLTDDPMVYRKIYRAILIDPRLRIVRPVEYDGSSDATHELVAADDGIDCFALRDHRETYDYGWCDDEGLTRGKPIEAFLFSNRPDPIGGLCLITGVQKETGSTCDAKFSLDILRREIIWLGMILPEVTWDEPSPGHHKAIITYSRVRA